MGRTQNKDMYLYFPLFWVFIVVKGDFYMAKKKINSRVKLGDNILFSRKGHHLEGTVIIIRDNSVIVTISEQDSEILDYDTNQTVVNHSHFTIISNNQRVVSY